MSKGMRFLHHSFTPGRGAYGVPLVSPMEDEVDFQHSSWPETHVGQELGETA